MTLVNLSPAAPESSRDDDGGGESLLRQRLLEPFRASRIETVLRNKRSAAVMSVPQTTLSNFKSFLSDVRKLSGMTDSPATTLKAVLDSSDLGMSVVDDALKSMSVAPTAKRDFLRVNGVYLHEFESFLRSGDLLSVLRTAGRDVSSVTEADKKLFSNLARDYPEKILRDIDEVAAVTKTERPQLNVTFNNVDKLSDDSLRELGHFRRNWKRYAGAGSVALVVGAVTANDSWFRDALASRRGCWMVKTVNGKSTSCRVSRFTCGDAGSSTGNAQTIRLCENDETLVFYNVAVQFMYIANLPTADTVKKNMAKALNNMSVYDLADEVAAALRDQFDTIDAFIARSVKDGSLAVVSDPCSVRHRDVENDAVPFCRVCDTTADPRSTRFVDPKQLADNVTLKCVADPSLVDLLADMAVSTGHNLWDGIVSVSSGLFRYIKYGALVSVVVALVVAVYFIFTRFVMRRQRGLLVGGQQKEEKYVSLSSLSSYKEF